MTFKQELFIYLVIKKSFILMLTRWRSRLIESAGVPSKAHRRSPEPNTTQVIEIARTPSNEESTFLDFERRRKISNDRFIEKNRKILESSSFDFGVVSKIVTARFTTKRRPIITKKT